MRAAYGGIPSSHGPAYFQMSRLERTNKLLRVRWRSSWLAHASSIWLPAARPLGIIYVSLWMITMPCSVSSLFFASVRCFLSHSFFFSECAYFCSFACSLSLHLMHIYVITGKYVPFFRSCPSWSSSQKLHLVPLFFSSPTCRLLMECQGNEILFSFHI